MQQPFLVNVITGQGGAGHHATYRAIQALAEQQGLPWQFQVIDIDDVITELAQTQQINTIYSRFGSSAHQLYNRILQQGWTCLWPLLMRLNKQLVRLNYSKGVQLFEQHWREHQPDLVLSVMPLFNRMIWESLQRAKPGTPVVTVLTDFADCPPNFWLEAHTGNVYVCGTDKAVAQARSLGVAADQIVQTSGLVIHPDFYLRSRGSTCDRSAVNPSLRQQQRQRLGLDPDRPTGLVMFGGNGSPTMLKIAQRLATFQDRLQLIFMCGRNPALASQLRQAQGSQNWLITTFTNDMPDYMRLADFFIGKPGNVSISEAIAMQLPVITECNALTMTQERYCAAWIAEKDLGIVLPSFQAIERAVATLLQPEQYAHYRANLAGLPNRAVFEVVACLQRLRQSSEVPNWGAFPIGLM